MGTIGRDADHDGHDTESLLQEPDGKGTIGHDADYDGHDTDSLLPEPDGKQPHLDQSNQDSDSDDSTPTSEEWKTMKGYGSFITFDESDLEHTFRVHDIIYVLPTGMSPDGELNPNELWIAEIRSIRAHNSESVWIKAKWFYHPTELPKNVRGVTGKLNRFGNLERISSNQADFIPTTSCCGIATIIPFNEQDTEQEDIEDDAFFYRYDYDWQARTLKNSPPPCSICKKTYNPDTDTMHFCPRMGCCRSWHTACLADANWIITSSVDLAQRLESLSGNRKSPARQDREDSRPKKKARRELSLTPIAPLDPYANVPLGLLAVARQPVARGGDLGIVGNVRSVVRARKMLQEALDDGKEIPEDWEQKLGKVYDAGEIPPPKKADKAKGKGMGGKASAFAYQCPQCGEPI